jgi:hypothetical protein
VNGVGLRSEPSGPNLPRRIEKEIGIAKIKQRRGSFPARTEDVANRYNDRIVCRSVALD